MAPRHDRDAPNRWLQRKCSITSHRRVSLPTGEYHFPQESITSHRRVSLPTGEYHFPQESITSHRRVSLPTGEYHFPQESITSHRRVNSGGRPSCLDCGRGRYKSNWRRPEDVLRVRSDRTTTSTTSQYVRSKLFRGHAICVHPEQSDNIVRLWRDSSDRVPSSTVTVLLEGSRA